MKLIDVLQKECIVASADFGSKDDALKEIVNVAKKSPVLNDVSYDEILTGLTQRESLGSTGFGKGIAIPHCRLKSVTDFVVGIITLKDGIDFDALDKQKVRLLIFIIAPDNAPNRHLKLLSAISQTLLIPGVIDEILVEQSSEAIYESFLRHTHPEIDTKKQNPKVMFNIFVQDESVFQDIFEKLAGIETSSLVVADVENAEAYLSRMPLFADFWSDNPDHFSKVITLVVDKGLSNETIRRVESVTGDLGKCSDVMVTGQDLYYSAGSL